MLIIKMPVFYGLNAERHYFLPAFSEFCVVISRDGMPRVKISDDGNSVIQDQRNAVIAMTGSMYDLAADTDDIALKIS